MEATNHGRGERGEASEPRTWSLLKAVERFPKETDVGGCNRVFKPKVLAVDRLSKMSV